MRTAAEYLGLISYLFVMYGRLPDAELLRAVDREIHEGAAEAGDARSLRLVEETSSSARRTKTADREIQPAAADGAAA